MGFWVSAICAGISFRFYQTATPQKGAVSILNFKNGRPEVVSVAIKADGVRFLGNGPGKLLATSDGRPDARFDTTFERVEE